MIKFSFDTNVLIYAADADTGDKHSVARDIIRQAVREGKGAITEQSTIEFLSAARRKLSMPFDEAVEYVESLLNLFELLLAKGDIVDRTLKIVTRHRLSIWDARMIAVCSTHGCPVLISEDMQDRARYADVRVINPFKPSNKNLLDDILRS
jgi:predicted nucleic acid-binding protein